MITLKNHITHLLAQGKYFFSKQDVMLALSLEQSQFRFQAYRLLKKRFIKNWVIIFL